MNLMNRPQESQEPVKAEAQEHSAPTGIEQKLAQALGVPPEMYDQFCLGVKEEANEHPDISPEIIGKLAFEHLQKDPGYYSSEEKGEVEGEGEAEENPNMKQVNRVNKMAQAVETMNKGGEY